MTEVILLALAILFLVGSVVLFAFALVWYARAHVAYEAAKRRTEDSIAALDVLQDATLAAQREALDLAARAQEFIAVATNDDTWFGPS